MKGINNKLINLATASFPYSLALASDTEFYHFYGNKTLSASIVISASGVPSNCPQVIMYFDGVITPGIYTVTVLGQVVPSSLLAGDWAAIGWYSNGAWIVRLFGNPSTSGTTVSIDPTTGALEVVAGSLTNAKVDASAAISFSKMETLEASMIPQISAAGVIETSGYPSSVIPYIANLSSDAQAQITAVAGDVTTLQGDMTTAQGDITQLQTDVGTAQGNISSLQSDVTAAQGDITTLQGQVAALTPGAATYGLITGNTTLTAATLKSQLWVDATSGSADLTLPAANTIDQYFTTKIYILGANAVRLLRAGSDTIYDLSNAAQTSITITGASTSYSLMCDGSSTYRLGK